MARPKISTRQPGMWTFPLSVRWADMDMLGHVNNAKYFSYSESARIAFFESVFGPKMSRFEGGSGPILADIGCSFHRQVHYPASLEIGVVIPRIGRSSLDLRTPIFLAGEDEAVADVRSVIVWFDYEAQKPTAVPDALQPFLQRADG